jgi:hypothetical protein
LQSDPKKLLDGFSFGKTVISFFTTPLSFGTDRCIKGRRFGSWGSINRFTAASNRRITSNFEITQGTRLILLITNV